jgi:hypothetical protein
MAINTYATLQTAIANFLKRDTLTSVIPDFIALAEADFNRKLRTRNQEARETFTLSTQYTDLTTLTNDILEIRNIQLNTNPVAFLEYRTPFQLDQEWPHDTVGKPVFFTIHGDELEVKPIPDSSYTAEMTLIAPFAALSDSNTTSWLLTNHPDIYLYGALVSAEGYIINDARLVLWKQMYEQAVADLNAQEKKARFSGSPLKARTSTGNP